MGFNHSIKVPTQYKRVAHVLKTALETNKSLKGLMYEEKHVRMQGMQAVLKQYIEHRPDIDHAIEQTKILEENPRLCPALCKVLVTELIFGRKQLNGDSRPVTTVRSYKDKLIEAIGGEEKTTASAKRKDVKPRYMRINRNLLTFDDALDMLAEEQWRRKEHAPFDTYEDFLATIKALEEDEFMIDMHVNDLFIFHVKQRAYWATHQYVKEKKFLLQDKGTCLVAELLQPPPGSVLLDMCAAPGMKTIHACNIMQNKGKIYAIEKSDDRHRLLCNMTTTAGCQIVEPILADALTIDNDRCPGVEYILLDPPCSGSGMQNRMSITPDDRDELRLKKLAALQIKFLTHAMSAFPDVKRITYSTCSLYEEENEQVVQRSLELCPQFKLLSGKKALRVKGLQCGNTEYKNIGKNCLYTKPSDLSDGIFIAIFEKRKDATDN